MPGQKVESSRPGSFVGGASIAFLRTVHEPMAGIGIGMKFMWLLDLLKLGVELRHFSGRRIAIVRAQVALDWCINFRASFEPLRYVTSPLAQPTASSLP